MLTNDAFVPSAAPATCLRERDDCPLTIDDVAR